MRTDVITIFLLVVVGRADFRKLLPRHSPNFHKRQNHSTLRPKRSTSGRFQPSERGNRTHDPPQIVLRRRKRRRRTFKRNRVRRRFNLPRETLAYFRKSERSEFSATSQVIFPEETIGTLAFFRGREIAPFSGLGESRDGIFRFGAGNAS